MTTEVEDSSPDAAEQHPARGGHPLQPVYLTENGVVRFKKNRIVRLLLDWSSARGMDMNAIATLNFPAEDREQFAQLIGYSLSGFGELSYVSDAAYKEAEEKAEPLLKAKKEKLPRGK